MQNEALINGSKKDLQKGTFLLKLKSTNFQKMMLNINIFSKVYKSHKIVSRASHQNILKIYLPKVEFKS